MTSRSSADVGEAPWRKVWRRVKKAKQTIQDLEAKQSIRDLEPMYVRINEDKDTGDNVVEDALRTSAAVYTVGIQHRDSL